MEGAKVHSDPLTHASPVYMSCGVCFDVRSTKVSMRPAMKVGLPVRIKNSYNPSHPGTVIAARRDCGGSLVTAITFKKGVELVDIVSTRMLGQYG